MNQQVAKRNNGELTNPNDVLNEWGMPVVSARNIIIPTIMLMQGSSDLVKTGKQHVGTFVENLGNKALGKTIDIIPFYAEEKWWVFDLIKGKAKFNRIENVTSQNANHEYETTTERWHRALKFYLLLPTQVDKGDALPYTMTFKSTSYRTGQKIYTQMYMTNINAGLPPPGMIMKLTTKVETKDKDSYLVVQMELDKESDEVAIAECLKWVKSIKAGETKTVDETPVEKDVTSHSVNAPVTGEVEI